MLGIVLYQKVNLKQKILALITWEMLGILFARKIKVYYFYEKSFHRNKSKRCHQRYWMIPIKILIYLFFHSIAIILDDS